MPLILHNETVLKLKSNYTTLYNHIKTLNIVYIYIYIIIYNPFLSSAAASQRCPQPLFVSGLMTRAVADLFGEKFQASFGTRVTGDDPIFFGKSNLSIG
jgi:hypothetical protein